MQLMTLWYHYGIPADTIISFKRNIFSYVAVLTYFLFSALVFNIISMQGKTAETLQLRSQPYHVPIQWRELEEGTFPCRICSMFWGGQSHHNVSVLSTALWLQRIQVLSTWSFYPLYSSSGINYRISVWLYISIISTFWGKERGNM